MFSGLVQVLSPLVFHLEFIIADSSIERVGNRYCITSILSAIFLNEMNSFIIISQQKKWKFKHQRSKGVSGKMVNNDRQVVIITGANNGIGFHMASALLDEGYRVAAFDLAGDNLEELQKSFPDNLLFCKTDVTQDLEVRESVEKVIQKWGQIDILVNNACLAIFAPFEMKDIEDTRREFEVNYFGYVRMINAVCLT